MTIQQLLTTLKSGRVAAVSRREWSTLGREFAESEAHETGIAGKLRLGKIGGRLVAVEEVEPDLVAVRPLASAKAATRFASSRRRALRMGYCRCPSELSRSSISSRTRTPSP